jgi:HEAT repeat protein
MWGYQPLPRTLDAALRDSAHGRASVRLSALADLARHAGEGSAAAASRLRALLLEDPTASVRAQAAVALADAGARDVTGALLRALEDPQPSVQQMALLALGELGERGDSAVARAIDGATREESAPLRFQALIAAERLGLPTDLLIGALDDLDPLVRHIALRLLEQRCSPVGADARPVLTPEVGRAVRAALGDRDLRVRLAAAIFLARAGEGQGSPVLVEAIASPGQVDLEDEQAAIVLAGELGVRAAMAPLERQAFPLFGRGRLSYEAQVALASMGHPRARAHILKGLSSFDRDRRTLAVVAVGRAGLTEARPTLEAMAGDPRRAEPDAVAEALAALEGMPAEGSRP